MEIWWCFKVKKERRCKKWLRKRQEKLFYHFCLQKLFRVTYNLCERSIFYENIQASSLLSIMLQHFGKQIGGSLCGVRFNIIFYRRCLHNQRINIKKTSLPLLRCALPVLFSIVWASRRRAMVCISCIIILRYEEALVYIIMMIMTIVIVCKTKILFTCIITDHWSTKIFFI